MWQRITAWPKANPFAFGVGVAGMKTIAADLLVQKYIERKEKIDLKRTGLFAVFGFAYLGVFQYGMYVTLFKRLFPNMQRFADLPFRQKLTDRPGQIDLLKQIGFDCFIHPIWFFPIYYTMKESIQGPSNVLNGGDASTIVDNAMTKYKKNALDDWIAFWKIWIVGDAVVMSLPLWARLPANHSISFVYVCVLSFMRGSEEPAKATDLLKIEVVES